MAYIGKLVTTASAIRKFDSIESSFNNTATSFTLSISSQPQPLATPFNLQVVKNGQPLEPYGQANGYTVSGNTITFTEAPKTTDDMFIISYAQPITIGVNDGEVKDSMLARGAIDLNNLTGNARSLISGTIVIFGN